jgi:hypothetical protein
MELRATASNTVPDYHVIKNPSVPADKSQRPATRFLPMARYRTFNPQLIDLTEEKRSTSERFR